MNKNNFFNNFYNKLEIVRIDTSYFRFRNTDIVGLVTRSGWGSMKSISMMNR